MKFAVFKTTYKIVMSIPKSFHKKEKILKNFEKASNFSAMLQLLQLALLHKELPFCLLT